MNRLINNRLNNSEGNLIMKNNLKKDLIQVAVSGARGKVGKLLVETIHENAKQETSKPTIELVAELHSENIDAFLKENNAGNEKSANKNTAANLDVIIDFSTPAATLKLLPYCCKNQYRLVIGTTGFNPEQKEKIIKASKEIPILFAPNMSIGINILYQLVEVAAKLLKEQPLEAAVYDLHHSHKKDSPSGTALKMGDIIEKTLNFKNVVTTPGSKNSVDLATSVTYSGLRLGDSVGEHSALFAIPGERLEISHKSIDRSIYIKGALQATLWLMDKAPGLYSMQDVLELK